MRNTTAISATSSRTIIAVPYSIQDEAASIKRIGMMKEVIANILTHKGRFSSLKELIEYGINLTPGFGEAKLGFEDVAYFFTGERYADWELVVEEQRSAERYDFEKNETLRLLFATEGHFYFRIEMIFVKLLEKNNNSHRKRMKYEDFAGDNLSSPREDKNTDYIKILKSAIARAKDIIGCGRSEDEQDLL